ncbi:putative tyrosine-protein kinase YveL [compost metagenome]
MNMLRSEETTLLLGQNKKVFNPSEVNLAATVLDQACRVILVTAPTAGSGTTVSAMSLAKQLAQAARGRVLLVDADPSANGLSTQLGLAGDPGLFELLLSDARAELLEECALRLADMPFEVLPLGQPSPSAGRFTVEDMQQVLALLGAHYRFVVIDAEAVYAGNSALGLASMVDGVVLVIRAEMTRWETAQAALERLRQADARLLGTVFNGRRYYMPQWLYNLL